jgi:hypothetical protein
MFAKARAHASQLFLGRNEDENSGSIFLHGSLDWSAGGIPSDRQRQ